MLMVEIDKIDMDGYCGRELHPEPTDEGREGIVVKLEREPWEMDGVIYWDVIYTVQLPDSREVELIEHEIKRVWISQ